MNRNNNFIVGACLFFLAFIFPPCYNAIDAFSGNTSLEWSPLWSIQGYLAINTTIWFATLGSIAFGTFIFGSLVENDLDISEEEYECSECGIHVSEDHNFCHSCGEKL